MFEGFVHEGVIVPVARSVLPADGSRIDCEPEAEQQSAELKPGWFLDFVKDLIVDTKAMPTDSALNHEHYRYGTPKR